ncbi:MAG: glycoside hydrolase family 88 protein, partial [Flavobacterium sp.]
MLNNTLNTLKGAILFISFTLFSCKTASPVQVKTTDSQDLTVISKDLKWSDKMALTLMKRHPEAYMIDDSKAPKWDYVHGLVLHGFEELYKKNPDPRYAAYIKGYVDILVESDGNIKTYEIEKYNIDMIVAGRLLFNLYDTTKDNRYLIAMQTLKKQLENHPRTNGGGFWHKKIYPNQMWLDGL